MLTTRLQALLNVRERVKLVRLYFAGNNMRSNLKSPINVSRNRCFSSVKRFIPVCNGQKWLVNIENHNRICSRLCHTETNDDTTTENLTENNYAHGLLLKRGVKTQAPSLEQIENVTDEEVEKILNNDWTNSCPEEILRAFESLSWHARQNSQTLNAAKHGAILNALNDKLSHLDDDKFLRVFACLKLWQSISWTKFPAYVSLWMELDRECIRRLANWNSDEALVACDCWYNIRLARKVKFPMIVLKKLGRKPGKLTPDNFLSFLFMINVCRKPAINMYEVEYRFDKIFNEFTANELAIVAMGFFKSETSFRDHNLVTKIHHKMLKELDSMGDISISAIMKITRYSIGLKGIKILRELLQAMTSRVPDLSIPCLTNVIHAAAFVQCDVPDLMNLAIEKFAKNIDTARIKDIERFSWALSIFDYDPNAQVYKEILASLRDPNRKNEMERFPTVTATTLSHLSFAGIFPTDVIKKHFDPTFLHQTYDCNPYKIGYNFFTLESNLRIDMPEYEGPFLLPNVRDFHAKKFVWTEFHSPGTVHPSNKLILEVAHMCKLVLKSETSIHIDQVLPHYVKPDIIVCLDKDNNAIDPQPILSKITQGTIKYSPQVAENLKWIAIVLATQNQIIRKDKFVGPFVCKLRQLTKIGYSPIVVPFMVWENLRDLNAKQEYLREKLFLMTDQSISAAAL